MLIENLEEKLSMSEVNVRRTDFVAIRRLGFTAGGTFVVDTYTTPGPAPRGSYFTSLPISSKEYRRDHPSAAGYRREGRKLVVLDDWGTRYTFMAKKAILDLLVKDCIANELPEKLDTAARKG